MTHIFDDGERWVKSGLLGQGVDAHYDIDRMTPESSGPVIAQVLVSHVTEEARRTASARADLICSIPELIRRAEAAEARAADAEIRSKSWHDSAMTLAEQRDDLRRQLEQAQQTCERMNEIIKKIAKEREDIKEERDNLRLSIVNNVSA